jgi:hypothetical protein
MGQSVPASTLVAGAVGFILGAVAVSKVTSKRNKAGKVA